MRPLLRPLVRRATSTRVAALALFVAVATGACALPPAAGSTSAPHHRADRSAQPAARRATAVEGTARPKVIVYGDSLTWESREYVGLLAKAAHLDITVYSRWGTAPCDWLVDMFTRIPKARPAVVVDAFYGNSWTACMRDARGNALRGAARVAKYANDTKSEAVIAFAAGARLVLVGAPRAREQASDPAWQDVRNQYRWVVAQHPGRATFADAAPGIAPHSRFAWTRPCLSVERSMVNHDGSQPCRGGAVHVHAPDGLHFCDAGLNYELDHGGLCPHYMPGAYRYAQTIVTSAAAATTG